MPWVVVAGNFPRARGDVAGTDLANGGIADSATLAACSLLALADRP